MKKIRENLEEAYKNLLQIKSQCSFEQANECGIIEMTIKQIKYLKIIHDNNNITFSKLAALTKNSKPTITEVINRFIHMGCVYKERSLLDGRVSYIKLTKKGIMIAKADELIANRLIDRIVESLDVEETILLIELLKKIK